MKCDIAVKINLQLYSKSNIKFSNTVLDEKIKAVTRNLNIGY